MKRLPILPLHPGGLLVYHRLPPPAPMWAPLVTPHHHVGSTGYPPPQRGLHRLRPSPTRASRVNPPFSSELHRLPPTPTWAPQVTPLPQVGSTDFSTHPHPHAGILSFSSSLAFPLQFQYFSSCCSNLYCQRGVYYCVFIAGTAQSNCWR